MHRHRRIAPRLLAAIALALATAASGQDRPPATVRVDPARREQLQQRRMITGDLVPVRRSRLAGQEPGIVSALPVLEGQVVEAGDVVARLDDTRLVLTVAEAESNLEMLRAVESERAAEADRDVRDLQELRDALADGAANPKEVRDAEADVLIARARLAQAQRDVAIGNARLEFLRERLADTKITAPFRGVVIERHSEVGQWLALGDPVVEIIDLDTVEVWLDVPQELLASVRQSNRPVTIEVGSTGQSFESETTRVVPSVDARARTFSVVTTLANEDQALAPGMSVVAWVPTGEEEDLVTVSKSAILRNAMGPYVYVVREGRGQGPPLAEMVQVEIRYPVGDRFALRARTIDDGDLVVTEGNERLFPMSPVAPIRDDVTEQSQAEAGTPTPPAADDDAPGAAAP